MPKIDKGWTRKVILRYCILQLPSILLILVVSWIAMQYIEIPIWLIGVVLCGWIIKDAVLFPFVWKSYDTSGSKNYAVMIGKKGVIVNQPDPVGTVLINGEFWRARAENSEMKLEKGSRVIVTCKEELILTVKVDKEF